MRRGKHIYRGPALDGPISIRVDRVEVKLETTHATLEPHSQSCKHGAMTGAAGQASDARARWAAQEVIGHLHVKLSALAAARQHVVDLFFGEHSISISVEQLEFAVQLRHLAVVRHRSKNFTRPRSESPAGVPARRDADVPCTDGLHRYTLYSEVAAKKDS